VYVGHLGFALAGKGWRQKAPLWLLVLATQGCDWVQVVACVAGPASASAMWSHSIPAVLVLATALSLGSYLGTRDRALALLVGAITISHIVADYATGAKPTWPGGPVIGLNLYSHAPLDFLLESAVVSAGWVIYRRSLPAHAARKQLAWLLLVALVGMQLLGALDLAFLPRTPKCM